MKTPLRLIAAALLFSAGLTPGFASAEDAPAGGAWVECNILAISAYRDHIGVRCTAPSPDDGAPRLFAVEMTNPLADAVLRLAQQSLALKRPLRMLYVLAAEGNPAGCPAATCRGIVGVEAR